MSSAKAIWTDGACKGNPGPGGWAWVDPDGPWASGSERHTTNQRMEVKAALEAVRAHPGPLVVMSDSTYVVNCFRDRWWEGWLARGWRTSARKPVANRDLWEPLVELVSQRGDVTFRWVKGHSADPMNDLADRLAVAAAESQAEASGDVPPQESGPADEVGGVVVGEPAAGAGRDRRLPPGRLVGVFGSRPPEIGGYDENPTSARIRRRLGEILVAKRELHPDLVVVTGARLGVEMLGAEAAVERELPYVLVLPFPDPDSPWPPESRRRLSDLCERADSVITLERKVPDTPRKVGAALRRRDGWLSTNLDEAVVFWTGEEDHLSRTVRSLGDRLGEDLWEEMVVAA